MNFIGYIKFSKWNKNSLNIGYIWEYKAIWNLHVCFRQAVYRNGFWDKYYWVYRVKNIFKSDNL